MTLHEFGKENGLVLLKPELYAKKIRELKINLEKDRQFN